ncbi:hypothetical protein O4H29_16240 [Marinobacter salarius]|uniref:hypothetical protein n=1 Tax=Marinobacter salarius TaxID=1420917 RepID=UPI0022B184EE|nr:hypothetical protein [Marinobacter salarius]MCZ4286381.1 hypothetical protein [Marinobacter salarius]
MPVADAHAERRNLTVLSLSIIVYFLAGGVPTGNISLPMLSIKFTRSEILAIMVWAILVWFHFRYWQETRSVFQAKIRDRLAIFAKSHQPLRNYLKKSQGHGKDALVTVTVTEFKLERYGSDSQKRWIAATLIKNQDAQGGKTVAYKFESFRDKVEIWKTLLSMSKIEGCTWAYWTPYILAGFAYILGGVHLAIWLSELCKVD